MIDLNIKWKPTKPKENVEMVKQLQKLGWVSSAWTTASFGKIGVKAQKQSTTIVLDSVDMKECSSYRGLVGDKAREVTQLSRINVTVDDVVDAQALTAGNETLNSYDIVAACPGNAAVFAYLCKSAQVDIISIDFSRKVSFPMIKKQLDQAIERGVHFEILYAPLLNAPASRKDVLAGTRVLVQFLRGRNIILSSGAESASDIRGPFDVINMGQMLNMTMEQAKSAITKNCDAAIQHGRARRLKFIPVEVVSIKEANQRWLKRQRDATSVKKKQINTKSDDREKVRDEESTSDVDVEEHVLQPKRARTDSDPQCSNDEESEESDKRSTFQDDDFLKF